MDSMDSVMANKQDSTEEARAVHVLHLRVPTDLRARVAEHLARDFRRTGQQTTVQQFVVGAIESALGASV